MTSMKIFRQFNFEMKIFSAAHETGVSRLEHPTRPNQSGRSLSSGFRVAAVPFSQLCPNKSVL